MLNVVIKAIGVGLIAAALWGQPTLRVDVDLVRVPFVVTGANGAPIADLRSEDLVVLQDKAPQQIKFLWRDTDLPLTIGLVADMSGSQSAFVRRHRETIQQFLSRVLSGGDRAFLVAVMRQQRLATDLTSSVPDLREGVDRLRDEKIPILGEPCVGRESEEPEEGTNQKHRKIRISGSRSAPCGGTALWNGMFFSARLKLQPETGRKALLVLTDGQDTGSDHSLVDAIEACQSAEAMVYAVEYHRSPYARAVFNPVTAPLTIAILSHQISKGTSSLHRMTSETGGVYFDSGKSPIEDVFAQVERDMRSQYVLAYTPTDHTPGAHKIQVQVKRPGAVVRARTSYYIPK